MSKKEVIIDTLNIRLPNGWQGDPVYLARKISEQIQYQSAELSSARSMDLTVQNNFSGNARQASQQFARRLNEVSGARDNSSGDA